MFSLNAFIKKGLLDAIGKMADYQIILNAVGWHEKGVLTEEDLAEINTAIEAQHIVPEESVEEGTENEENLY
jgi:chromosome condensin MukBEF ATPase and DNA-binding subunit MukB